MSDITKSIKIKKNVFGALSALLNIAPLIGAFIYAICSGELKTKQDAIVIGIMFVFTIFIGMLNLICKWHLRTPLWILIFTLMFMIKSIWVVLLIMGICTIVDELIFSPLHKHFKDRYKINKEIDKRL